MNPGTESSFCNILKFDVFIYYIEIVMKRVTLLKCIKIFFNCVLPLEPASLIKAF